MIKLIAHNDDIERLIKDGYDVRHINGHIVIVDIPYVDSNKTVQFGALMSPYTLQGQKIIQRDHTVFFTGSHPCDANGKTYVGSFVNGKNKNVRCGEYTSQFMFSTKPLPAQKYRDFHHKFSQYIKLLVAPAQNIDPSVSAQHFRPLHDSYEESVFHYVDTNSTRAGITSISERLKRHKIGIIGLGGTGSYILDFVAKTPVQEINLYDGDIFDFHNAFRAPGAAEHTRLNARESKVDYHKKNYSNMHKNIIAHNVMLDKNNLSLLDSLSFVFLSMDTSEDKKTILDYLIAKKIPFVDTGIGVTATESSNQLRGQIRATMGIEENYGHIYKHVSTAKREDEDEYQQNIQVSELNALAAIMAVMKWKKHIGFYHDFDKSLNQVFAISDETLSNEDYTNEEG
ncbi:ThiF family adenylyltransferase [Sulfurovum mangrovi]|uniref:ThiF family adenylyltransferase n=1 Tax=Sulfurovum mangrovi TaxID=2893889 RepID=UPI001E5F2AAE|nr:ThiF family adenylyltransferase [Sulfurovum mangrovi]UFH58342.1 ThiF family adenylyltransferase [Sulfurovum mangrovi]